MSLPPTGSVTPAGGVTLTELTTEPDVAAIAVTGIWKFWPWPTDRPPATQVTVCPTAEQPAGSEPISNSGAISSTISAPVTVNGPRFRTPKVMVVLSPRIMVDAMDFCATRSAPGSIVVMTGGAVLSFGAGSKTVGLVSSTKALLVMVPPLASTRPVTFTGGNAPMVAGPV